MKKTGELSPCNGGCWFCYNGFDDPRDKAFSFEFDTNFHISCLHDTLKEDHNNGEAQIIAREYGITYDNEKE